MTKMTKQKNRMEINDEKIKEFVENYIERLPSSWRTDLDFYLGMKNAMMEALSFPEKYIISNTQETRNCLICGYFCGNEHHANSFYDTRKK